MKSTKKKVCVVGAGEAGLVAVKECLEGGLEATCYDMDTDIGGLWHQNEDPAHSPTPMAWDNLVTNIAKNAMAFSDFPMPLEQTPYMNRKGFYEYLVSYAKHFGLHKFITLQTKVVKVCRAADFSQSGQWIVYSRPVRHGENPYSKDEDLTNCRREIFDAVLICSGNLSLPVYPAIDGLKTFSGEIIHSKHYKNADKLRGKTVMIVGNACSAFDIAEDVVDKCGKLVMAIGQGSWVLPRIAANGIPWIETLSRSAMYSRDALSTTNKMFMDMANQRLDHEKAKINPPGIPFNSPVAVCDSIQMHIMSGKVDLRGYFTAVEGSTARFDDQSSVDNVDVIIFCTGFKPYLGYLEDEIIQENGRIDLYNMTFPLEREHNTLAILGLFIPDVGVPPILELQARYAVKIITGDLQLPSQEKMKQNVDMMADIVLQRKRSYIYLVPGHLLQDLIAQEMGVYPYFWKIFWKDRELARKVWYGPVYGAHYRLLGPGSNWAEARKQILKANEDIGICPGPHRSLQEVPKAKSEIGVFSLAKWLTLTLITVGVGRHVVRKYLS